MKPKPKPNPRIGHDGHHTQNEKTKAASQTKDEIRTRWATVGNTTPASRIAPIDLDPSEAANYVRMQETQIASRHIACLIIVTSKPSQRQKKYAKLDILSHLPRNRYTKAPSRIQSPLLLPSGGFSFSGYSIKSAVRNGSYYG